MTFCWVVGFVGGEAWTTRLLRRGFGHVWCARPLWGDLWLWVEWTPGRLVVGPVRHAVVQTAMHRATECFVVDRPSARDAAALPYPRLGWWHCVRVVVDALALPLPWWPTPWGLRCALVRARCACKAMGDAALENPMRAPKAPAPSPEERELVQLQTDQLRLQKAQMVKEDERVTREEAEGRVRTERSLADRQANRVGSRSLLSGDFTGFVRGGDLRPR